MNYGSTAVFALLLFSIKRKWFVLFSHSLLFPVVFWVDVFPTFKTILGFSHGYSCSAYDLNDLLKGEIPSLQKISQS